MAFARRYRTPGVDDAGYPAPRSHRYNSAGAPPADLPGIRQFSPHEPFEIDGLRLEPFPVPHDAREPAQFVFTNGDVRLGYLTDLGFLLAHVGTGAERLSRAGAECNHDRELLQEQQHPPSHKARIAGAHGHLSTTRPGTSAADFGWLRHIVAAHLSEQNNRPDLAWRRARARARLRLPATGCRWRTRTRAFLARHRPRLMHQENPLEPTTGIRR